MRARPRGPRRATAPRSSRSTRSKAAVARAALDAGATYVNDVTALRDDPEHGGARRRAPAATCCLMHMLGEPRTMQDDPRYDDVVDDVKAFLASAWRSPSPQGIAEERIQLDPGIGFGKTLAHNLELLRRLDELTALGRPVVVGHVAQVVPRPAHRPRRPHERVRGDARHQRARARARGARLPRPRRRRRPSDALTVAAATLRRAMAPDDADDDRDDELDDDDDDDDDDERRETEVTIEVTGLSLYTHHGVTAAEREVGQRLVLDLRLEVGESDATVTDRVEDTVDYGEVCQRRRARRPAALLQDARAPVHGDRRPAARRLRRRGGLGQGGQARAADPAARSRRSPSRSGARPERRRRVTAFAAATAVERARRRRATAARHRPRLVGAARRQRRLPRGDRAARDGSAEAGRRRARRRAR